MSWSRRYYNEHGISGHSPITRTPELPGEDDVLTGGSWAMVSPAVGDDPELVAAIRRAQACGFQFSVEHLMTDASAMQHRHSGRYLALCGVKVVAASLAEREHSRCQPCREQAMPPGGRPALSRGCRR